LTLKNEVSQESKIEFDEKWRRKYEKYKKYNENSEDKENELSKKLVTNLKSENEASNISLNIKRKPTDLVQFKRKLKVKKKKDKIFGSEKVDFSHQPQKIILNLTESHLTENATIILQSSIPFLIL
jgi:hypothetical protein